MLISFSVGNFLSFKSEQTLTLVPDALKEHPDFLHIPHQYDINYRLLKSVALYGHNSHGKSNFLKAYDFFRTCIFTSFVFGKTDGIIDVDYFKLNTFNQNLPSIFEAVFLIKEIKYRYRFEILSGKVIREDLWYAENKVRENYLFVRLDDETKLNKGWSKESPAIQQATLFTKSHNLYLSVLLSQEKMPRVSAIGDWLKGNLILGDTIDKKDLERSVMIMSQSNYRGIIHRFLSNADVGFVTIVEKIDSYSKSKLNLDTDFLNLLFTHELEAFEIYTQHDIYDEKNERDRHILFELLKSESAGTIKFLTLSCFMAFAMKNGQLLWVDELDSKLHVYLLHTILKIFNEKGNSFGSQMIFTIHNTSILDSSLLRRDQVSFIEKDQYGASSIYRMHTSEKPVRKEVQMEKKYLNGDLKGVSKKAKNHSNLNDLFS